MMAGKNQASQQPTAMGSMLQAATYGLTIPVIMGRVTSPLLAIWANGLRQGGSIKKFKQMKKGITAYCENIDFLIGKNPILGTLQMWNNGGKLPLNFTSQSFSSGRTGSFAITDSHFYAVIGVTVTLSYSQTFNDYGNPNGAQSVSGTFEQPLWNSLFAGPDPTDNSGPRNYPYCYRWQPSYGATVYIDADVDGTTYVFHTVKVYYAALTAATSYQPPISRLRLTFENELGNGPEYAGYTSEQIVYPWYAGLGSPNIDLGSTGTIPQLTTETQGKYGVYPTGDCDFVDMIEEPLKSGITQAAIGGTLNFGPTQHGVGLYDFPGAIQKKTASRFETHANGLAFDMPNTAGNCLLAYCETDGSAVPTISDSLGNTWTLVASGSVPGPQTVYWGLYRCANCLGGTNTVSFGNYGFYDGTLFLLELAGVDTFDVAASTTGSNPSASITTTNAPGQTALLLALSSGSSLTPTSTSQYPVILSPDGTTNVQMRRVSNPGTYALAASGGSSSAFLVLLAFKATQPATFPNPLPNILDPGTRELARLQCRAGGLWGSLSMNTQKPAREWIQDCCTAGNIAPVMSGFSLKLHPRSEVSAVGNGAIYNAPTASGPVANLDADKGDFITEKGESPIQCVRKARTDLNNVLQMQHLNRASDYQQVVTTVSDAASIRMYGVRKEDPTVNNAIMDVSVARAIETIELRRRNYVEPLTYKFKLNTRWQLLEVWKDLITITDRLQGIYQVPVRITSMEEDDKYGIACEAEPFIYGVHSPESLSVDIPQPYSPTTTNSAGSVNAPVIFEPTPRLYGVQNQPELWLVVSSPSTDYGGCVPHISTDGGMSYNALEPIAGNAITGVSTADWPASASSPDTTHDLALDLTESLGTLASYQVSDEDNSVYPCYIAGGGTYAIPYELMTYATATLTAANKYTLKATGTGNHLNRGVWGAPALGIGVDHPTGSRFAFLSPDGTGILKLAIDPLWIGKTLYFKFPSINTFGGAVQALSDCTAYSYTIAGTSGSVNPTGVPPQTFLINGA